MLQATDKAVRPISIHALREEGDDFGLFYTFPFPISIHALREEGDALPQAGTRRRRYFYPRPPRGGRQRVTIIDGIGFLISIHALREEGDTCIWILVILSAAFLSTPSARRATSSVFRSRISRSYFYPRPPRGGRPANGLCKTILSGYFYPRPPRGGRPVRLTAIVRYGLFLSTPSARRATRRPSGV